ncbi:hypothetical protein NAP1_14998 [Erythrobacter sp. NAP1]|uniref:hypothetical protein n=1 Tax=Erythrobacter sp. NAP1 TaxID=237727 RepID=UPI000068776B|nr:hypothetical protein [Erythrobacter sp. NAP1]EAQ28917.1 hypothetical protein NAP1_14998 [Erythrobacter sp. NAP1]
MSFTAALLIIAQSAAPSVAVAPVEQASGASAGSVSVQASASARIIRSVEITFDAESGIEVTGNAQNHTLQRSRDDAGTYWIEFS